jgi:hypothetical protein
MFQTGFLSILIPLASSQQNLYDVYLLLCIQYQTPDDGEKTCPKHMEFYSKITFEKLVHLVGFIIGVLVHEVTECGLFTQDSVPDR